MHAGGLAVLADQSRLAARFYAAVVAEAATMEQESIPKHKASSTSPSVTSVASATSTLSANEPSTLSSDPSSASAQAQRHHHHHHHQQQSIANSCPTKPNAVYLGGIFSLGTEYEVNDELLSEESDVPDQAHSDLDDEDDDEDGSREAYKKRDSSKLGKLTQAKLNFKSMASSSRGSGGKAAKYGKSHKVKHPKGSDSEYSDDDADDDDEDEDDDEDDDDGSDRDSNELKSGNKRKDKLGYHRKRRITTSDDDDDDDDEDDDHDDGSSSHSDSATDDEDGYDDDDDDDNDSASIDPALPSAPLAEPPPTIPVVTPSFRVYDFAALRKQLDAENAAIAAVTSALTGSSSTSIYSSSSSNEPPKKGTWGGRRIPGVSLKKLQNAGGNEPLDDAIFEARHAPLEKEEKVLRSQDKKIVRWVICDDPKCRKWRILEKPWTYSKFYCGYHRKPRERACGKLDDWILRCLGGDKRLAYEFSNIGVKTVEGLEDSESKKDKLRALGYYYDAETQAIKALE